MHRRQTLKALAGFALCPLCTKLGFAAESAAGWSYCGPTGPDNWPGVCSTGKRQSPIYIASSVQPEKSVYFILRWADTANSIENNGHTIELYFPNDYGGTLTVGAPPQQYTLVRFHFHQPSEHWVRDQGFAVEAHFVHENKQAGATAVVGVLMERADAVNPPNPVFARIAQIMPSEKTRRPIDPPPINPNGLLPPQDPHLPPGGRVNYYRYDGSLTTPDCDEPITWLLLADPIYVADADVTKFAGLFGPCATTARPLQRRLPPLP